MYTYFRETEKAFLAGFSNKAVNSSKNYISDHVVSESVHFVGNTEAWN